MKNVVRHRLFMVPIILLFVFVSVIGHYWLHPVAAVEQLVTKTPIKHLVVIYSETHSFDNYFATYPVAANQAGEPRFTARGTPSVNGLTDPLLTNNPNSSNPFRIERKKSFICNQSHDYTKEQLAYNGGLVNKFPQETAQGPSGVPPLKQEEYCAEESPGKYKMVLGYYDRNTVTALWNYAQNFALSDNFYATTFGPFTIGALNLVTGDNYGELCGVKQDTFGEINHLCGESTDGPGGRCGYGPRAPLLAISPCAKKNYVSHWVADQSSILRFIEDNWLDGQRISDISFDRFAGTLNDIFDFSKPNM